MDAINQPLLDVRDLSVAFHQPSGTSIAVDQISFAIKRGECVALVGESGSGKSVSALSILKLLPYPTASHPSGSIHFRGRELLDLSEREIRGIRGNDISIIFQEPMTSLNPLHTIESQIGEIMQLHSGVRGAMARQRTLELLTQVGIPDPESRLASYPHQLSGGQRQRVMIAMALANEPDLLIADEPTTALDVTVQAQILRLLQTLQRELGLALLLITHDLGIVARMADRVSVMYAGEVVESASSDALFAAPTHPYTRGLLRCIPVPGKTKPGAHLGSIPGLVPNLVGELRGCSFLNRCAHALTACGGAKVALKEIADGHAYRCLLPPAQCAKNAVVAAE